MTVGRPFVLRNTHFSKINSGEDLAVFMNVCPERSYQRGDVLFRSGDPATELHVIAKGQLKMLVPTATGILADHLFTCRDRRCHHRNRPGGRRPQAAVLEKQSRPAGASKAEYTALQSGFSTCTRCVILSTMSRFSVTPMPAPAGTCCTPLTASRASSTMSSCQ